MVSQNQSIPKANAYGLMAIGAVAAGLVVYAWMYARTQMIVERAVGVAAGSVLAQDQQRIRELEKRVQLLQVWGSVCQPPAGELRSPQLAP